MTNALAVIAGGVLGTIFGEALGARTRETVMAALSGSVMFVAVGGVIQEMLKAGPDGRLTSHGAVMFVVSLALGALLGEWMDLDEKFDRFGAWMRRVTHNEQDDRFVNAFVTASLTFCIGAMAIIGSIDDGLKGDPTILYVKSVMDFICCMLFAASLGKGAVFAAVPVFLYQGAITVGAKVCAPLFTPVAMSNLSYVGNVLIFFVGWNLIHGEKKIRVANLLPSLVVAVVFGVLS